MAEGYMIDVDLSAFVKSAKKISGRDWPKAVVDAFADIAMEGVVHTRVKTRMKFKLHTDYITKGIRYYPATLTQRTRAARALKTYHDMNAAVYLRPSSSPRHSLEFMAHHEFGVTRKPRLDHIAMPMPDLKSKAWKTAKGRVKKRWKPSTLLERFKAAGSSFSSGDRTTTNKGKHLGPYKTRTPGDAFLMRGSKGNPLIVRRINKAGELEFLYALRSKADIKDYWGFVDTVYDAVKARYVQVIQAHIKRIPNYNKLTGG